ncbi:type IV pilin-like G/H family protein [Kovacikia minuta CCNUW1]|uniref:type IV pilin-like G/H family protein n=1 Tax=Kovacikia minuta TaxID=2931930 RepID=UPI001CCE272D|nr:type IV pilin-like G/H family protein [Kovacikia minuta]UBF24979.1 type IV pilin-like G/H family protein [Kovacikia minuta CCNUW1]
MNQIRKYWLLGFGCLGAVLLALYLFILSNDCPPSICVNPVQYKQRRGNAYVTDMNRILANLLMENKELVAGFQREKCFWQDEWYVFLCQTIDKEAALPKAFNYALSRNNDLKSYVGGVFIVKAVSGKRATRMIVCEAKSPGTQLLPAPIDEKSCGAGSIRVEGQIIP